MNKLKFIFIILILAFTSLNRADAHIEIVYPRGGEVFMPGSVIAIQWKRSISHNQMNWDVYYSSDGGTTWQAIKLDLPDDLLTDDFTYLWTVPKVITPTTAGRIRVVQDNFGLDYESKTPNFTVEVVAVSIDHSGEVPERLELFSAYPNPFSTSAVIAFKTSSPERVVLEVFDTMGKRVAVLLNRGLTSGLHRATWNAGDSPAGVYFYRIKAGDFVENRKIILVR